VTVRNLRDAVGFGTLTVQPELWLRHHLAATAMPESKIAYGRLLSFEAASFESTALARFNLP
jgi:hypothetical protein